MFFSARKAFAGKFICKPGRERRSSDKERPETVEDLCHAMVHSDTNAE
jgi:hypothetical protein